MGAPSAFTYADVDVVLEDGTILEGVSSLSYKRTQQKTNNYSRSRNVRSRSRGKNEFECSINLDMLQIKAIKDAAGTGKGLPDIKAQDLTVVYLNDDGAIIKDVLVDFEFTEDPGGFDEEQMDLKYDVECIISNVRPNI